MESKQEQIKELLSKYAYLNDSKLCELGQEIEECKVNTNSRSSVKEYLLFLSHKKKEIERIGEEASKKRYEQILQQIHSQINCLQDKLTEYSSHTEWSIFTNDCSLVSELDWMEDRMKRSSQTLQQIQSKSTEELYQSHEEYLQALTQAIAWVDRVLDGDNS